MSSRARSGADRRARPLVPLVLAALAAGATASQATQAPGPIRLEGRGGLQPSDPADATGAGLAFVELEAARESTLVQEPVRIRLRFGLETEFLRAGAVQLFARELDVPVQVEAPWFDDPVGARALAPESDPADAPGFSFVLNGSVATARAAGEREVGGKRFAVYEIERAFLPAGTGPLSVPAPSLRFAGATRFEEDFVSGLVAREPRDLRVRGAALTVTVLPLPEEGRPPDFSGAVGRFTVEASAEPRELALGSSLALVVRIAGDGDLGDALLPNLDALADFHLQGELSEAIPGGRSVTYHLAPARSGALEIAPVEFSFFDATPPAGYRRAASEPIAIRVLPAPAGPAERAPAPAPPAQSVRSPLPLSAIVVLALVLFGWLAVLVGRAGRSARPPR